MCHVLFGHPLVLPSPGPVLGLSEEGAAAHGTQLCFARRVVGMEWGQQQQKEGLMFWGCSTSAVTPWVSKLVETTEFHLLTAWPFFMMLRNIIPVPCGKAADK